MVSETAAGDAVMPINAGSRLRQKRTELHGWREGDDYFLSLKPRAEKAANNRYASSQDALREASRRSLPVVWDDPAVVE